MLDKSAYINSFLTNPLLLSLYILTFQSNSSIPTKRFIFYRRVIEALFSEHDSRTKIGYVREKRSKLSQEEFEEVLQRFCFITFFEHTYDFEKDYLVQKLDLIKKKHEAVKFENNELIDDLKLSVSLWTEDNGVLSFAHRSLQEYFAALFLKNLTEAKKQDVYRKILIDNPGEESSNLSNFLSLCEEMDAINFYKYLLIPFYDQILNFVVGKKDVDLIQSCIILFYKYVGQRKMHGLKRTIMRPSVAPNNLTRKFERYLNDADYTLFRRISEVIKKDVLGEKDVMIREDENKYVNVKLEKKLIDELYKDKNTLRELKAFVLYVKKSKLKYQAYIEKNEKSSQDIIDMI
jgi:hypothetical protein